MSTSSDETTAQQVQPKYLTRADAAKYLGVSEGTLRNYRKRGLRAIKFGPGKCAVRFDPADLHAFAEASKTSGVED